MEVNINKIKPNNYNPKNTDDYKQRYQSIKDGIKVMGMKTPLDVRILKDGSFELIDGYHRLKACKELGWKKIPITNWGQISDEVAKKITILKEKAHVPLDIIKTSEILNELVLTTSPEELIKQIGYTLSDLQSDLEIVKFDWSDYDKNTGLFDDETTTLSVVMTKQQYEIIIKALDQVKKENNVMSTGRALELICAEYLSGI